MRELAVAIYLETRYSIYADCATVWAQARSKWLDASRRQDVASLFAPYGWAVAHA